MEKCRECGQEIKEGREELIRILKTAYDALNDKIRWIKIPSARSAYAALDVVITELRDGKEYTD